MSLLNARERRQFGLLAAANALVALADIAALALMLLVIGYYTQASGRLAAYLPTVNGVRPLWPALAFLLFFLLKNAISFAIYRLQSRYVYGVASRMSRNQLRLYLDVEYSDYVAVDSSAQHHLINHQPVEFAHFVLSGIQQIFTEGVLILLAVVAILAYNAKIFLILLVFLLPAVLLAAWIVRRSLRAARTNIRTDAGMAMQYLQEALHSFIESHIYGRKAYFTDRYYRHQRSLNSHLAGLQVAQWIPGRMAEVFAVSGLFLLILINRHYGTLIDAMSIGAFVAAAYKIIPGIGRIANAGAQIRTYGYTTTSLARDRASNELTTTPVGAPIVLVEFRGVSFSHGDKPVVRDFSMKLERGDLACLVGSSGRGKTSLLNILLGFLQPSSGSILINGRQTSAAGLKDLHPRISFAKQQPFFIHGTMGENISLSADPPDGERMREAVRAAGLDDLIGTSPEGLDRSISDGGKNISGGQRQRVALARALYKDADLIILDEPFSELDEASEERLLAQCRALADAGRIVLLVSHSSRASACCNKKILLDG